MPRRNSVRASPHVNSSAPLSAGNPDPEHQLEASATEPGRRIRTRVATPSTSCCWRCLPESITTTSAPSRSVSCRPTPSRRQEPVEGGSCECLSGASRRRAPAFAGTARRFRRPDESHRRGAGRRERARGSALSAGTRFRRRAAGESTVLAPFCREGGSLRPRRHAADADDQEQLSRGSLKFSAP